MSGARLQVYAPGCEPLFVDVAPLLVVGRAAEGLVLDDERCSRVHCRFEAAPSGLMLEDLGSTNGTFLNGAAVVGPTRVRTGDVVVAGATRIVVVADGAPMPSQRPGAEDFAVTVVRLRGSVVGGTMTIAFTDIVDSTAIGGARSDHEWFALLERHDRIARGLLDRFGGSEVKHQGDGFMLTFPSAYQAVQFGVSLQRELARQRELDPSFPLHVRMGIHTGEVLHVDGDLFGRHVNLAARVAGAARADEVLVSSLVYDLVVAIGDVGFGEPRHVELKGFAEQVVVRPVADRPPA